MTTTTRRRLNGLLGAAVLGTALLAMPAGPASAAITCIDAGTDDDTATPYYSARFDPSHTLSQATLDAYVPQGLTTWRSYYGPGHDLLLMSAYNGAGDDRRAILQGIDQRDGSLTHRVVINTGHAGGVAVHGGYVVRVRRERRASCASTTPRRWRAGCARGTGGALDGTVAGDVYGSSFLAVHDGTLFAGRFNPDARDKMGKYPIRADGNLGDRTGGWVAVPTKTQGLAVSDTHFVFSTSEGRNYRSNLYVVARGYGDLDDAQADGKLRCFRAPTMAEGITFSQGKAYLVYESGAAKYAEAGDKPDRIIRRLHVASRDDLPVQPRRLPWAGCTCSRPRRGSRPPARTRRRSTPGVAGHLARRQRGEKHPVEDFLFTYYRLRPGALRRWHPGVGDGAVDATAPRRRGRTSARVALVPRVDDDLRLDLAAYLADRAGAVRFVRDLLSATASRPAQLGCFGLHEWAMVYRLPEGAQRHEDHPLRLGSAGTDRVVEDHRIRCSHHDAFRFFTPDAVPLNPLQPTRSGVVEQEQPGCLHATMDLYKWAGQLGPARAVRPAAGLLRPRP